MPLPGLCIIRLDSDGRIVLLLGENTLPRSLWGRIAPGVIFELALDECIELERLVALVRTLPFHHTKLRIDGQCWRVQSIRLGASHIRNDGFLFFIEPCDISRMIDASHVEALARPLALTGEEGFLHGDSGELIAAFHPEERLDTAPGTGRTAHRLPLHCSIRIPPTGEARAELEARGWCSATLPCSPDRKTAGLLVRSYAITYGPHPLIVSLVRGIELAEQPQSTIRERPFPAMAYRRTPAPDFRLLHADEGSRRILRMHSCMLFSPSPIAFNELIHPSDEARFRSAAAEAETGNSHFRLSYIVRADEGRDVRVLDKGTPVRDEHGRLLYVEGTLYDIGALDALHNEAAECRGEAPSLDDFKQLGIIGRSQGLKRMLTVIGRAATSRECVLILGESGSGKELAARAVHEASKRASGPFVSVNCGAIPECLMESEFFGHRKGAFSGADRNHAGLFEQAHGGTLFLDEIGEIPLNMQIKLLRAIEGSGITPVGGTGTFTPDVRIVAATNRDLAERVRLGAMREDFYYRINILPIRIPPLRERREDIPLLFGHFLGNCPNVAPLPGGLLARLMHYDWPGNVRELRNAAMRYATLGELPAEILGPEILGTKMLGAEIFDTEIPGAAALGTDATAFEAAQPTAEGDLRSRLSELEREILLRELESNQWNRSRVATRLGIDRRTLYDKIRRYDLRPS
ncbi:DNA-binding NtrC family response regulator/PAS domain-containing protein [Desulfobaculum xiamenense]|uniref:DNA-binding NtrC family response regulator/PAS domain-containing protein n=1 Tax=Desulfobaculum xiamenense TaxID=995050 RepID=A0A846QL37_9BACT|nr:DNA-binding NtrC family response regulator/PAS domain-containing protein [Desulfobaculum xiamenense]